jgi:hypothetical protein
LPVVKKECTADTRPCDINITNKFGTSQPINRSEAV